MRRRLKQVGLVVIAIFASAQLIRPGRTNPTTDPSRTISVQMRTENALPAVLKRSCYDCHSNNTVWPWYTKIAPVSWIMASAVNQGRAIINFSEWGGYSPEQRRELLLSSCRAAREGRMPGIYERVRPETRLSAEDIGTICAAVEERTPNATAPHQGN